MKQSYLNLARGGKNSWWRYCLGILFIFAFWNIVGSLFTASVFKIAIFFGFERPKTQYFNYLPGKIIDIFSVLAVFLALKWFHNRQLSTVISIDGRLSKKRLLVGTIIGFAIISLITFTFWLNNPFELSTTYKLKKWLWLFLIVVLTFVQSAGEELIFRGYLLQGFSFLTRNALSLICLSSFAFAYCHFIPPFYVPLEKIKIFQFSQLFILGAVCTVATLKENRIEMAIGIHFGHNLFMLVMKLSGF